jgi:ubiquinone biosynthesis protein
MPEFIDLVVHAPVLLSDAIRFFEHRLKRPPPNPLEGVKSTLFAGFSLVSGALAAGLGAPWWIWAPLFGLAVLFGFGARNR